MESYQLITSDVMKWFNLASRYGYRRNYYHAMLLDPPYHLTSITKRFSKGTPAKYGTDGAFQQASAGFMGQTWDGGDIAFNPELWVGLKEMAMILQLISFMGLGFLLAHPGFYAQSSWEFWAIMGLGYLSHVAGFWQGKK